MNEPLIILHESEDGHPVRHFVDGDASRSGGAARHDSRGIGVLAQDVAQRAWFLAAELGPAAAALTKAGLKRALRR
jgi:hypothetical protein